MKVFYLFLLCVSRAAGQDDPADPSWSTEPADLDLTTLKEGDTVILKCTGSTNTDTITIHKGSDASGDAITEGIQDLSSGVGKTLTFSSVTDDDVSVYTCKAQNSADDTSTAAVATKEIADLVVNKPKLEMTTPTSGTPVATEEVVLTCSSTTPDSPTPTYAMMRGDQAIDTGLTDSNKVYTISSYVAAEHDGDYTCKVTVGDNFLVSEKLTIGSTAVALTLTAVLLPVCLLLQTLVN